MPTRKRFPDDLLVALAMLMIIAVLAAAARPPQTPRAAGWGKKVNGEIRYRARTVASER